jgi:tripartite-type tricarboxylate transporter receptor subunit TctC
LASPSARFKDIPGLIAYAKQNPGKVTFGVRLGTSSHLFAEMFQRRAGIQLMLVPYKSSTETLPDLMAGRIDLSLSASTARPLVESGKVNAIAVSSGARWAVFPQTPTLIETGVRMTDTSWYSLVVGPATPKETIEKLRAAFAEALKEPAVQKKIADEGMTTFPDLKPEQLAEMYTQQQSMWRPIVREAGIKLD